MSRKRDDDGTLSTEEMQASLYRAFTKFEFRLGHEQPDWQDLDDEVRFGFMNATNILLVHIEGAEDNPRSIVQLAEDYFGNFYSTFGTRVPEWPTLPIETRLLWDHLVRHCANLLAYDTEENEGLKVDDHEDKIDDYFRARLEEIGFSPATPPTPQEDPPHEQAQPPDAPPQSAGVIFEIPPADGPAVGG